MYPHISKFVQCSRCYDLSFKDALSKCRKCGMCINRPRPDNYFNLTKFNEVNLREGKEMDFLRILHKLKSL
jgi:ribosomal protein L37E